MNRFLIHMARKGGALALALIVFITTTGFQFNAHYCAGNLKSFSFYGEAKACKHEVKKVTKPCAMHGHMEMSGSSEKDCCNSEGVSLEPAAYEAVSIVKTLDHQLDALPAMVAAEQLAPLTDAYIGFITTYRPPPVDRDIIIMVQSFLL